MTESPAHRELRGFSRMLHLGTVLRQLREGYAPRFGVSIARKLWAGAAIGLIGAWISVLGLAVLLGGIVCAFALGNSPTAVLGIAQNLFWVIITGFTLTMIGSGIQASVIKNLSARIRAVDESISDDGATRLIKYPQLYDRWFAQHPGFSVSSK